MPSSSTKPRTPIPIPTKNPSTIIPPSGIPSSNPHNYFSTASQQAQAQAALSQHDDLRSAIISGFNLPRDDNGAGGGDYVYHAIASVTLKQVQSAIRAGTENGLCDWYPDAEGKATGYHPPPADIHAYTSIFSPENGNPGGTLKSLNANAKKGSLREGIAANLISKGWISEECSWKKPSKAVLREPVLNLYLEFWTWSCFALKWAGPGPRTAEVKISHAVLPIFMHHFGCVVPSLEALDVIRFVAHDGKKEPSTILDVGSGNGYWTYMLRGLGLPVIAVDNKQSVFRCNWIGDTIIKDGGQFLHTRGDSDVLLLVYPVVGADFFRVMLEAYKGDRIVVAGTQCRNGYTALKDELVDEWMAREKVDWELELRIPLPSFAGKDEALYFFRKRKKKST